MWKARGGCGCFGLFLGDAADRRRKNKAEKKSVKRIDSGENL